MSMMMTPFPGLLSGASVFFTSGISAAEVFGSNAASWPTLEPWFFFRPYSLKCLPSCS